MVTSGAIRRAKLQSNRHHQQTNTQFFTGQMPFLSPNHQCQGTEPANVHAKDQLWLSGQGTGLSQRTCIRSKLLPNTRRESLFLCNSQGSYNRTISRHGHIQQNKTANKPSKLQTVSQSDCAKVIL